MPVLYTYVDYSHIVASCDINNAHFFVHYNAMNTKMVVGKIWPVLHSDYDIAI